MTLSRRLNTVLRILGIAATVLCIGFLWSGHLSAGAALAVTVAALILVRLMVRAGLLPNPFGETPRDYRVRPLVGGVLLGLVCFVAAFVWGVAVVLAIHYRILADSPWVLYGLMGVPFATLMMTGGYLLLLSGVKAVYGRPKT